MGQHFASLRDFFRMENENQSLEGYSESIRHLSLNTLDQSESDNITNRENNGNIPSINFHVIHNRDKPEDNLNNDLNLDVDNHNSRFESIYSQPIDGQEPKQCFNNGNFIAGEQETFKQEEACCSNSGSSNTSSSSEDSPVNPVFRRSSKTLSFGKRKSEFIFIV
jgi:hypothetical protein